MIWHNRCVILWLVFGLLNVWYNNTIDAWLIYFSTGTLINLASVDFEANKHNLTDFNFKRIKCQYGIISCLLII